VAIAVGAREEGVEVGISVGAVVVVVVVVSDGAVKLPESVVGAEVAPSVGDGFTTKLESFGV
jgi:hypothetical protein